MSKPASNIRIGTSGYEYPHWNRGVFYPKDIKQTARFTYYVRVFNTVEINTTFYGIPRPGIFQKWREAAEKAPGEFIYTIKAPRAMTHTSKLANLGRDYPRFISAARYLKPRLAVILVLLPASVSIKLLPRVRMLIMMLHRDGFRAAFEFRHQSWYVPETAALLRRYNMSFVFTPKTKLAGAAPQFFDPAAIDVHQYVTSDFLYIRFHGSAAYSGGYSAAYLEKWAKFIKQQARSGRQVFAFFNNDVGGRAPIDAKKLKQLL